MIARTWHGAVREPDADRYLDYLEETGVKACRETPGNLGVQVLRRVRDGRAEFVFTSFWESMDAVRAFAGADVERAVYYPEDARWLLEMEPGVRHYEVVSGAEIVVNRVADRNSLPGGGKTSG
ncbi:MAG TPA: antibiotic biosynthesis monooxygenase [Longimicrobium sp.]|nr:antibiotic biosynthesis monooxygenase [Longimicrobium sp.]